MPTCSATADQLPGPVAGTWLYTALIETQNLAVGADYLAAKQHSQVAHSSMKQYAEFAAVTNGMMVLQQLD